MCTIAILLDVVSDAPLVVAANRDEMYARPTRPPQRWTSGIVAGVDELSGGTWLAVRPDGQFAAVTNQRVLAPPPPGLRSRGLVVRELAEADDPAAYVSTIDPARYASMNLVWGDARGVSIAYARTEGTFEVEPLAPGIHVLCNDRLDAPGFPRGVRLREALERVTRDRPPLSAVIEPLHAALADHTRAPIELVPPSRHPPEIAHALTAACIHTDGYGTRSATIFAAAPGRVLQYLHADGPPCTTPLLDRSSLFHG